MDMSSQLQTTLLEHIQSGWQSNPALMTLIHDYMKYHAVLVIVGGAVLLVSLFLAVRFWMRFKKISRIRRFKWPFEKKLYFAFGTSLTLFSLFFTVVWAANLSTTLNPLPGFTSLASTTTVPDDSATGKVLTNWVQSASTTFPPVLEAKVQKRINWQRPKTVICGMLLIVFIVVTVRVWSYLIKQSKTGELECSFKVRALIFIGMVTFASCLLLAVMVVANAQGAIGPIAISLLGIGG